MSDNPLTIGIDHGYAAMKTKNFSFPTGLVEYEYEPYTQKNVLEFSGKYYVIGSGRQPLQKNKTLTEDYYLLTLAAIAKEMDFRKADAACAVHLAAGLPLTSFGRDKKRFREYLLRDGAPVSFRFEGSSYAVTIAEVSLFLQGYAAVLTQPDLLNEPSVILADIGGWTVDLMRLDNRVPNASTCRSLELGMIRCLDEIAEQIRLPAAIITKPCTSSASMWKRNFPRPLNRRKLRKRKENLHMNDNWRILHGDALKLLGNFPPGSFDAVITDPPYASGGRTQAEKNKSTTRKYSSMGDAAPPPFEGDAKDQRSWTRWAAEWLADARRICRPGAPVCMFIDWRQLPAASDALQWAGWIWRGTAVWDKGNSRPQKGRFRQQAEYIVWGSNGDMPVNRPVPCLPGVFKYGNPQNRIHLTEKPLQLMRDIVKITEPGGHILDPFAGSGTTVLAAVLEGYTATGIEITEEYARLSRERVETELSRMRKGERGL